MDGGVGEAALASAAFDTAAFEGLTAAEVLGSTAATTAATSAAAATAANAFDPYAFEGISQYMAQAPVNPVTQAVNAGNMANLTGNAPGAFQGMGAFDTAGFNGMNDLTYNGFRELADPELAQVMKDVNPEYLNSLRPEAIPTESPMSIERPIGADLEQLPSNMPAYSALNAPLSTSPSALQGISSFAKEYKNPLMMAGTSLGLRALMNADSRRYGVPGTEKYTGPLSKFSYNPSNYRPDIPTPPANPYRAQYAAGGPVEQMSNQAAMGANTMYPMANMATSAFATPYQSPVSTNMLAPTSDSGVTMGGEPNMQGTRMAQGGQVPSYGFGGFIGDAVSDIGSQLGHMFKGGGGDFGNVGPMLDNAQAAAGTKYDPVSQKYVPDNAQQMAEGGIARLASGGFFKNVLGDAAQLVGDIGGGAVNLVSNLGQGRVSLGKPDHGTYEPYDDYSKNSYTYNPDKYKTYTAPNPNTYQAQYAGGGIASLGSYSDGGRMLKGPGDGMSDNIPAKIGGKQEARLADGEFVVPADVVSHLGNGSTDAGARQLYSMMDKVRTARTGRKAQGRQIKPNKYMPA